MSLAPYTGPFGRPELIHLLRRTLFGVSPGDLSHFDGMSLTQVVNELLTFTNTTTPPLKTYALPVGGQPDPTAVDPDVPFGTTWTTVPIDPNLNPNPSGFRRQSFMSWWAGNMLQQERNIREKLVLCWHTNLATQASTVQVAEPVYQMNQLLRDNCLGNYRQLMYDVSVSPAMLIYLNGYLNNVFAPDENYARELMELFTLGEGSGYTEDDVQAAARVLTGWSIQFQNNGVPIIPQTTFIPFLHDTTDKTFSPFFNNATITGQTGANAGATELNALLDMIFQNEEVSRHICRKLYRFFVHGGIDAAVEADIIEPLAQVFRDNATAPDQLRIVMETLLLSEHFFSNDVRACMVGSPADFVIGTMRTFGQPLPDASTLEAQYLVWRDTFYGMAYAGLELGEPPNVAGWAAWHQFPQYDELWMDSASYAGRKDLYELISYVGLSTPNNLVEPQSEGLNFKISFFDFVQQLSDPGDPNVLVAEAAELLFGVPVSQSVRDQLKTNYLLFGQLSDSYWTTAYFTYAADPNTTDPAAQLVPTLLLLMFLDMQGAAERHLI